MPLRLTSPKVKCFIFADNWPTHVGMVFGEAFEWLFSYRMSLVSCVSSQRLSGMAEPETVLDPVFSKRKCEQNF